jgi:pilus assembly protein Flp/PilA
MLVYARAFLNSRIKDDRGASAVEYGLLVAAIAAVIVGIVFGLGTLVKNAFSKTSSCISGTGSGC